MEITLTDYNIIKANVEVIKALFKNEPFLTRKQYAGKLGMSDRTLYRYINDFGIVMDAKKPGKTKRTVQQTISDLQELGYQVTKTY